MSKIGDAVNDVLSKNVEIKPSDSVDVAESIVNFVAGEPEVKPLDEAIKGIVSESVVGNKIKPDEIKSDYTVGWGNIGFAEYKKANKSGKAPSITLYVLFNKKTKEILAELDKATYKKAIPLLTGRKVRVL